MNCWKKEYHFSPHSKKTKKAKIPIPISFSGILKLHYYSSFFPNLSIFLLLLSKFKLISPPLTMSYYDHQQPPVGAPPPQGQPYNLSSLQHILIIFGCWFIHSFIHTSCRVPSQGRLPSAGVPCSRLPCSSRLPSSTPAAAGLWPTVRSASSQEWNNRLPWRMVSHFPLSLNSPQLENGPITEILECVGLSWLNQHQDSTYFSIIFNFSQNLKIIVQSPEIRLKNGSFEISVSSDKSERFQKLRRV